MRLKMTLSVTTSSAATPARRTALITRAIRREATLWADNGRVRTALTAKVKAAMSCGAETAASAEVVMPGAVVVSCAAAGSRHGEGGEQGELRRRRAGMCRSSQRASQESSGSAAPAAASPRVRQHGDVDPAEPRDRLAVRALHRRRRVRPRREDDGRDTQPGGPRGLERQQRVVDRPQARAARRRAAAGRARRRGRARMAVGESGTSSPPTPSTTSDVGAPRPRARGGRDRPRSSVSPAHSAARCGDTGGP